MLIYSIKQQDMAVCVSLLDANVREVLLMDVGELANTINNA
jgi:hypothetical protein